MTLSVRMILPALAVALVAWAPSASFAQLAEWDQERVTAIAKEFAAAAQGVQDAFRKEPSQNIGSGQSRSYYRLQQLVRRIKTEARHLAAELENGKGHDETLPIYRNLMEEVRDAREDARRTFTSSFVLDKVAVANDALRRLAPYYDPKALSEG